MSSDRFIAHRLLLPDGSWANHSLREHLEAVGRLSAAFAPFSPELAELAGRWHDLGKYSNAFQDYIQQVTAEAQNAHIEDETGQEPGRPRTRVNHSSAGAQQAAQLFHNNPLLSRTLGYLIAGHHAGLPDWSTDPPGLVSRLSEQIPPWRENAPADLLQAEAVPVKPVTRKNRHLFGVQLWIRMLFSALVDADFLDTEAFLSPDQTGKRSVWAGVDCLHRRLRARLRARSAENAANPSPMNELREAVLAQCLTAAEKPPGFFKLTVPTGGGKTLSSLAFALEHARRHDKKRVIYAIPFTSIIEQNAAVFRAFLKEDPDEANGAALETVLEHHSTFEAGPTDLHSRLAAENWDAGLIVTTNVQLFESLFAARTSRCRKLHNLQNSVIVLDEAQMLPSEFLRPCLYALAELVHGYGATVVFCTATQPPLDKPAYFEFGPTNAHEIMQNPTPAELESRLKRVRIEISSETRSDWSEVVERLWARERVLCILNTRKQTRELFDCLGDPDSFHLSALMCPAHRREVLAEIRSRLKQTRGAVRVISTQLVEAGVDLDFPSVFRALAGLDSVVQAAGRCNREFRMPGLGEVWVFTPPGGVGHLVFKKNAEIAQKILSFDSNVQDVNLTDLIDGYYRRLYHSGDKADLDKKNIIDQLSKGVRQLEFPFRTVAAQFQLIESGQKAVFIPWRAEGERLLERLRREPMTRELQRSAQAYTVQLREKTWNAWLRSGELELVGPIAVITREDLYDEHFGLRDQEPNYWTPESLNP